MKHWTVVLHYYGHNSYFRSHVPADKHRTSTQQIYNYAQKQAQALRNRHAARLTETNEGE